jgi:uncharacterized cupredoxin-like copper-binding protein
MRTQVSQLYVSLFGRAPDAEGLGFWASALADGMTMARLAQEMYNTSPARDYYPTAATNREIVATFYLNVLGREADAGGLDFWTREMDVAATKGDVFAKLLNNVVNYTGSDAAGLKSQALFLNKVSVAQYYGEQGGDIINAADVLVGVTDKYATVIEAKAAIDAGVVIGVQTYEIANEVTVIEGGAVVFNITTTGVAPGTDIVYSVTGTGNALASTQIGLTTVNSDGTASITVTTLDNGETNDVGALTLKLMSGVQTLATADVVEVLNNDSAKTYTVLNVASIIEGSSVTYNITTTGVAAGTEVSYMVIGTGNAASAAQVGSAVINAEGKASVTISTVDNLVLADTGALSFVLKSGSEILAAATDVEVVNNDSAKTYAVASASSVGEGNSVTYNISTTGVAAGTEISYMVTGTGNASASAQVGSVVINAEGKGSVTINTYNNLTVADDGTLSFVLKNGSEVLATADAVTVTNNDNAATYAVAVNDTSIAEGDVLTYTITTTGVAPGTDIAYVVTGTGNATASTQVGLATINVDGKATVHINTYANTIVGDAGVLNFKLVSNSNTLVTADAVSISNDDLPPPNATASVTAREIFGTGEMTEGDIVEFVVSTTGYVDGTVLPYMITGTNNVFGSTKAGFVTIHDGQGTVQLQTTDNETWNDAGSLTFNLGNLDEVVVQVLNDDVEIFDNTYTLTKGADTSVGYTDTNGGDDVFNATIGGLNPTLTRGDKLDGGTGSDTLYIKVNGNDALFPDLSDLIDTPTFNSIEHVVIDLSDHDMDGSGYGNFAMVDINSSGISGSAYYSYEDFWFSALNTEYFDTDGSLESVTFVAEKDSITEDFEDFFVHKDMTVGFKGSNVPNNAVALDSKDIALAADVKNITVELDGVGGYSGFVEIGFTQVLEDIVYYDYTDTNGALETLTINGTIAQDDDTSSGYISGLIEVDAALIIWTEAGYRSGGDDVLNTDGEDDVYANISPDTINIGLKKTVDADGEPLVETVAVDLGVQDFMDGFWGYSWAPLLRNTSTIDFTESDVNIVTWVFAGQFEADTVDINFGSGDDTFILDVLPSTDDADFATAITIDLGDFEDSNEIILSNTLSSWMSASDDYYLSDDDLHGGNLKIDSGNRDIDLIEDLITIDNFDMTTDKLSLDFVILHGESDGSYGSDDELTYVGSDFKIRAGTDVQDAADEGAASQANDSSRAFYSAVKAVADYLVNEAASVDSSDSDLTYAEVDEEYAAAFDFEGNTYIYIDTNRNGWEDWDSVNGGGGNLGLSTGDTLIKLTGLQNFTNSTDFDSSFSIINEIWLPY